MIEIKDGAVKCGDDIFEIIDSAVMTYQKEGVIKAF